MRVADGHTLLLKPQRLFVLPLPVIELSEHAEIEPFTACLPCSPADPQRFFKTMRGLIEVAGHDVDEGDDKEARPQDILIAKLCGERLRLVRELQCLFELMSKAEAKTDLVQGLSLPVPVPELSGHIQQALMGFDGGTPLAHEEMHRPFAGIDRHPSRRLYR